MKRVEIFYLIVFVYILGLVSGIIWTQIYDNLTKEPVSISAPLYPIPIYKQASHTRYVLDKIIPLDPDGDVWRACYSRGTHVWYIDLIGLQVLFEEKLEIHEP